jgi:hypothetical protein
MYEGIAATRIRLPYSFGGSAISMMTRTQHVMKDTVTAVKIAVSNWYWAGGGQGSRVASAGTSNVNVRASIEYPSGTFTQIKFGGAVTGSIASAGAVLISDYATVSIPKNATFWVRIYRIASNGTSFVDV